MGDPTYTRCDHARLWWFRHETPILKALCLAGFVYIVFALAGCATTDLRAHEERHCEGWTHQTPADNQVLVRYDWTQTRPASPKPWTYIYADDPHAACSTLGAQVSRGHRIEACATWTLTGCTIILPKDQQ